MNKKRDGADKGFATGKREGIGGGRAKNSMKKHFCLFQ